MRFPLVPFVPFVPFVVVLGACARSGSPQVPSGPLDVNVAAIASGAPIVTTPGPKMCEARLIASTIEKRASCKLDEKISTANGLLVYPCDGEGHAEARFDDQIFDGRISRGELSLTLVTTPKWGDECDWESAQKIEGPFRGELDWTLAESIVRERDDGGGCYGACEASAKISIKRPDGT